MGKGKLSYFSGIEGDKHQGCNSNCKCRRGEVKASHGYLNDLLGYAIIVCPLAFSYFSLSSDTGILKNSLHIEDGKEPTMCICSTAFFIFSAEFIPLSKTIR